MNQEKDDIVSENNPEGQKNHSLSEDSAPTHQVNRPPTFTLKDITTIKAGTTSSMSLESTGHTEGYIIKSVSVKRNGSYYTNKFRVKSIENQPIPATGLSITLTTDPNLKTGAYTLRMKIGKTGKGSKPTEQWVEYMIHVSKDEVKNESEDSSCSDVPPVQVSNNERLPENTAKNKKKHSAKKHTPPTQLSFTPKLTQ
ncbi:hypothetical protein ACRRVD_01140 [Candidatus Cardinium hertigii]|uniref:hypothetical protein n=1 Tax=Candidatus Cardinium hertigii TaxID=247481 RepID=UPI003D7DB4E6